MLALERRNLILEKLQNEKRVVVSELSQLYGVSEETCLLYTSPSPRDRQKSRMPSSA